MAKKPFLSEPRTPLLPAFVPPAQSDFDPLTGTTTCMAWTSWNGLRTLLKLYGVPNLEVLFQFWGNEDHIMGMDEGRRVVELVAIRLFFQDGRIKFMMPVNLSRM